MARLRRRRFHSEAATRRTEPSTATLGPGMLFIALAGLLIAGCSTRSTVTGDGSSTVFPIAEAVAEEFLTSQSDIDVVVGISGTGGGFQRFCAGEVDFVNASRAIEESEVETCAEEGIEAVEFQIAFDGLAIIANPAADFVDCLLVEELQRIWEPGSEISNWNEVRPEWPDQALALYGPDTDSGTFDYFTAAIVGEQDLSRPDYTASADDNVLVQGIAGDEGGFGYFGFAFYEQNAEALRLIAVDNGSGCVLPSRETILDGTYDPLSRPLFVYVRSDALARPEVAAFMRFYLTEGGPLADEVGYVAATDEIYQDGLGRIP